MDYFGLIFVGDENCRIQLMVVVIFRKLKPIEKSVMMMMQYINCVVRDTKCRLLK